MKFYRILLIFTFITSFATVVSADNLAKYKYCHAKYQDLNARQMHLERLIKTVRFHAIAFKKYNDFKHENLANFHKEHYHSLHQILQQQKQQFKELQENYNNECNSITEPTLHIMNHEHKEIISPI
ncbi:hypothetical protein E3983_12820 [Legionella israelensis]|uniref:Uncharacterized protein n=2 Tax=Legionella israelensis TaxID=454 RepID=A0A0W0W3R6_9GAMM|nr:hypothetical protein [Legionella israelensis]SCY29269.1 hypothetical protein SAMN02746069_01927 [Legionella israelensis DSM 19235]KTD26945.1 hypothetical protein Lisr_1011 [Legionella israelensis]QBR85156.1 hypothetical protein E3983_12820 [Legionella israelensis]QBS09942.1 hypothetical protein E4T55_08775 [Legionella israelensis]STX59508.1 Uncharacterised protein [Legionella israelensis]